jgi:ABC-type dipeptide/oligopeptide/nickel transport system permease component
MTARAIKQERKFVRRNGMGRYIVKRLSIAAITLFLILFILFLLLSFMPGSPFNNEEKLSSDQIAALKAYYGLDKPLLERFFIYIANMLHGDFGVSYNIQINMPISAMVGPRIWTSVSIGLEAGILGAITVLVPLLVSLMTGSLVIEKVFSIPGLGSLYITAIQSNDYNVVLAISFIYSVVFILAMLLVDVFYVVIDPRIRITGEE